MILSLANVEQKRPLSLEHTLIAPLEYSLFIKHRGEQRLKAGKPLLMDGLECLDSEFLNNNIKTLSENSDLLCNLTTQQLKSLQNKLLSGSNAFMEFGKIIQQREEKIID